MCMCVSMKHKQLVPSAPNHWCGKFYNVLEHSSFFFKCLIASTPIVSCILCFPEPKLIKRIKNWIQFFDWIIDDGIWMPCNPNLRDTRSMHALFDEVRKLIWFLFQTQFLWLKSITWWRWLFHVQIATNWIDRNHLWVD